MAKDNDRVTSGVEDNYNYEDVGDRGMDIKYMREWLANVARGKIIEAVDAIHREVYLHYKRKFPEEVVADAGKVVTRVLYDAIKQIDNELRP